MSRWTPTNAVGELRQDQFAFEDYTVLDTVIMGHAELWRVKQERDRIYGLAGNERGRRHAGGRAGTQIRRARRLHRRGRAGELLLGVSIPLAQHAGPMRAVAPGWKLRVLLAQALFADPDILLLDEPTNNLDINIIRWLEDVLNARKSTMVIISHDRHFLNRVCTHMADLDYGELRVYPGNYDEYMTAATQVRERLLADNAKKKVQIAELQTFVSRFPPTPPRRGRRRRARARSKNSAGRRQAVKPCQSVSAFRAGEKLYRLALEVKRLSKGYDDGALFHGLNLTVPVGERVAVIGPNGIGKTTLLRTLVGELTPDSEGL